MDQEKLVHIQARLPESMREEFKNIAKKNAHNRSDLIRSWIKDYIDKNKNNQ